ncbi:MAG TPA: phasin family protein [Thermoanaerobaculia bacterium]|nr:phasin family protein [Thermoanaerobaculia bacterium]
MSAEKRSDVTAAGRTIWLAGLGAIGALEDRGRAVFDDLVARGRRVESGQFKALDRTVCRAADGAEKISEEVREKVHVGLDSVLHRANLPTRDDLAELSARLDRLSERIEHLADRSR